MKTKITISLYLLLSMMHIACQNKKEDLIKNSDSDDSQTKSIIENNYMEKILVEQLNRGQKKSFGELGLDIPVANEKFEISDLEVAVEIGKKKLIAQGYKFIAADKFSFKIKEIFGRTIDLNSDKKFLYVNYFDKCDKNFNYYPYDGTDYNGTYIVKKECFITDFYFIPELIDYQKEFPQIVKIENSIIATRNEGGEVINTKLWKDDKTLNEERKKNIKILVARNMYLFNDSRAHFKWLILNDEYFMQSLVTTFGYYEDKELLKWVVENTKFDSNNPKELDKIFWNKKCDGTVKLNLEIFPVLKEIITPNDPNYLKVLKEYTMYLLEDKSKRNELSVQDRAKLLAYLVYFGEQYRYDENYNDQSFFMQRIEIFDLEDVLSKEIERNNFYNLPNYSRLYKKSNEYHDKLIDENGG